MSTEATEVRLSVLEREITLLRQAAKDEAEFRGELRAFMAEQRTYGRERASDVKELTARLDEAEKGIRELEAFKNRILGAVAIAGVLGGTAGGLAHALLSALGG